MVNLPNDRALAPAAAHLLLTRPRISRRLAAGATFAAAGIWGIVGCSLSGVVDVRVGECSGANEAGDLRCQEVLNPDKGNYPGCAAFKCVPFDDYFQCQEVKEEVCDGQDNDCDYLIDEPVEGTALLEPKATTLATGVSGAVSATLAESADFGDFLYVQARDAGASTLSVGSSDAQVEAAVLRTQKHDTTGDYSNKELTELQDGCYGAALNGAPSSACTIQEAVAAAGSSSGFFAYVNKSGCDSGELRVGALDKNAASEFVTRGLGSREPTYRGVATNGSRCSDNGTQACADLKNDPAADAGDLPAACGVSKPAIAAIDEQALVGYLGSSLSATSCPNKDVNVLGLVLHARTGTFGGEFLWADPSGDGQPEVLGVTRQGAPPAVLALGDQGFLVAFGKPDGGLMIRWVPKQGAPPANDGLTCPGGDCDSRTGLSTPELAGAVDWAELEGFSASAAIDGVRMSWLALGENEIALAISWMESCALGEDLSGPAYMRVLRVRTGDDVPSLADTFPVVALGSTQRIPLTVPAEESFVVEGFERGDAATTADNLGGFYALTQPLSTSVVRVLALDGELLDKTETITMTSPKERYLAGLGNGSFVTHRDDKSDLRTVSLSCSE